MIEKLDIEINDLIEKTKPGGQMQIDMGRTTKKDEIKKLKTERQAALVELDETIKLRKDINNRLTKRLGEAAAAAVKVIGEFLSKNKSALVKYVDQLITEVVVGGGYGIDLGPEDFRFQKYDQRGKPIYSLEYLKLLQQSRNAAAKKTLKSFFTKQYIISRKNKARDAMERIKKLLRLKMQEQKADGGVANMESNIIIKRMEQIEKTAFAILQDTFDQEAELNYDLTQAQLDAYEVEMELFDAIGKSAIEYVDSSIEGMRSGGGSKYQTEIDEGIINISKKELIEIVMTHMSKKTNRKK